MTSTNIWTAFKLMDPENSPVAMDTSREGSVSGSSFTGSYSGSGSNSTMSTTGTDEQGNEMLIALERKSVKPYKTKDEYLYAMKEDLAEWFNVLYNMNITVDNFFEEMETGVLLCEHANNVQEVIRESFGKESPKSNNPRATPIYMADYVVTYKKNVKPGTFMSRDNISNFLTWCVRLGIPDNLRFETDDLVLRKHERNVILCLLEVARRGAKYGMLAPVIIQLEEEIDAEIAGTKVPTRQEPVAVIIQRKTCDLMSLDEMVRDMVSECTCPSQFPMVKMSDGKYRIGDSQTLIFVRILRNHVMVRIGGGWDTLENYLDRHDPCRCHTRGHKHRGSSPLTVQMKRRPSGGTGEGTHLTGLEIKTSSHSKSAAAHTIEEVSDEDVRPPASPRKSSLGVASPARNSPHSSPAKSKRSLPNIPGNQPKRNTSPQTTKTSLQKSLVSCASKTSSSTKGTTGQNLQCGIPRPKSALERRHSDANNYKQNWQWGSNDDLLDNKFPKKTTDNQRSSPMISKRMDYSENKFQSMERNETVMALSPQYTNQDKQMISTDEDVLVISRDDTGRHKIDTADDEVQINGNITQNMNTNMNSGLQKTFTANKFQLTADKILPNKPKNLTRTSSQSSEQNGDSSGVQYDRYKAQYSGESDSYSESSVTNGSLNSKSACMSTTSQVTRTWSQESTQSFDASEFDTKGFDAVYSALCNDDSSKQKDSMIRLTVDDYPEAPPEDTELNRQMEELFEEYRKVERGLFTKQRSADDLLASTEKRVIPKPKSKQDFSKVQSKLKEYFSSSPKKSSTPVTPRHNTPTRMRSITPNPTTGNRSTPTVPRRTLPRAPSPCVSSSSSTSSHSAFTAVAKSVNPTKTAQPSSWTSAWRQNKPTTDLSKTCDTTTGKSTASIKRPQSARPSTPVGRPSTPVKSPPQNVTPKHKTKPASFRPASAPLHNKREPKTSINSNDEEEPLGFIVQSSGAWAVQTANKPQSRSVPQTPAKKPLTPRRTGSNVGAGQSQTLRPSLGSSLRSRSTTCLATEMKKDEFTIHSKDDTDHTLTRQDSFETDHIQSNPRKDTRNQSKVKTKIPMPVTCKSADPHSQHLKRCDSGVDINNISPTGSNNQGDHDGNAPWSQTEGVALSPQAMSEYSAQCSPFDDKNNEFF